MRTIIRLENVHKSYRLGRVEVPALSEVTLDFDEGDFAALAGPSGSGKTTLLNLIGCIDKLQSGRIELDGVDVTAMSLPQLADTRSRKIGFIFQTFNLLPVLTAFENVEYPLLLSGLERRERQRRVWYWLTRVGLRQHAAHRPDRLSGGQRQRVAIARAMVTEPMLILADEPSANLDSHTAISILDLLGEINRETGRTFLFATHDPRIVERASRIVHLRDGRVECAERTAPDWRFARC